MSLQPQINKEYQDLVPALTDQVYQALKQSIKEKGFWEWRPITVNREGFILDGHHRYRACQELGIEPTISVATFNDELEEKLFVIDCNLKRRQLNSFQRIELALKSKPILEEMAKRNQSLGGKSVKCLTPLNKVNKEVGKRANASHETVRKVEAIQNKAPQELLDKARAGQWTINKVYKKLQNEQKRQDLINTKPVIELPDNIRLIQGDFREKGKEIPDNSIPLILTDPPYSNEHLYLYKDLGVLAARVLKEGGSLITFMGHQEVLEAGNYVQESGLKYIHILSLIHSGPSAMLNAYHIRVKGKPILWFVKGTKPNTPNIIDDIIYSKPPDKSLHEWEQSPVEAEHIIKGLTVGENQVVLDPFMGVGTFGKAVLKLNRKFIGIEIDPQRFEVATANLASLFI